MLIDVNGMFLVSIQQLEQTHVVIHITTERFE